MVYSYSYMGETIFHERLHNKTFSYLTWAKYGTRTTYTYKQILGSGYNGGRESMEVWYFTGQISNFRISSRGFSWSSPYSWTCADWLDYVGSSGKDNPYDEYDVANGYRPIMYDYPCHLTQGTKTPTSPVSSIHAPALELTACGKFSDGSPYNYIGIRYYDYYPTQTAVCDTTNLIAYIRAPKGSYPNNGLHSDGYWYILQN